MGSGKLFAFTCNNGMSILEACGSFEISDSRVCYVLFVNTVQFLDVSISLFFESWEIE